jgi:hypothetical protein
MSRRKVPMGSRSAITPRTRPTQHPRHQRADHSPLLVRQLSATTHERKPCPTRPARLRKHALGRSPLESPQKEAHTQGGEGHVVATAEAEEDVQQKKERDDAGHDAQRVWSVETAGRLSTHEKDSDGDGDQGERHTDRPRQPCRRDGVHAGEVDGGAQSSGAVAVDKTSPKKGATTRSVKDGRIVLDRPRASSRIDSHATTAREDSRSEQWSDVQQSVSASTATGCFVPKVGGELHPRLLPLKGRGVERVGGGLPR